MGLAVIDAPDAAVSIEDAKKHLNVTHSDDDSYIEALIAVATRKVENHTSRRLMSQKLAFTLDMFPSCGPLLLPVAPIASIDAVKYYDVDGVQQTWGTGNYHTDLVGLPHRLMPNVGVVYPTTLLRLAAVSIEFTAGVGETESIEAPLLQAVLLTVGNFYANREPLIVGTTAAELPMNVLWLLQDYRLFPMAG
jgi:uncharacterized phiE125 gp8 family phage protein